MSDPAMEEALYETTPLRSFAKLLPRGPIPDETTTLNFRRLLETNELAPVILARVNAARIRVRIEHPFRVIKCQFGLQKVRFRGLAKNIAHVITLFALSNLWTVRKKLMAMKGSLPPQFAK